jgi:hypothetical protein
MMISAGFVYDDDDDDDDASEALVEEFMEGSHAMM